LFPGYHGGMIDHNTRRVLLSFPIIIFLTFDPYSRQVTSDRSEKAIVTIVLAIVFIIIIIESIILVYCFSLVVLVPGRSHVITLKGAIVMVAGSNILDET
jgi:RsiW-degrading membrane proteinase PrsW (M82 family)